MARDVQAVGEGKGNGMYRRLIVIGLLVLIGIVAGRMWLKSSGHAPPATVDPEPSSNAKPSMPETTSDVVPAPSRPVPSASAGPAAPIAAGRPMEVPSNSIADDVDPSLLERLRSDLFLASSTKARRLDRVLTMDSGACGESSNAQVQAVLRKYNNENMRILSLYYRGRCFWYQGDRVSNRDDAGQPGWDHHMDFRRNGRECEAENRCGPERRHIRTGTALLPSFTEAAFFDAYYLLPLTVQDPSKFNTIADDTIEMQDEPGKAPRQVEVYRISCPYLVLCLSRKEARFVKAFLRDEATAKDYLSVTASEAVDVDEIHYPTKIRVDVLNRRHFESKDDGIVYDTMVLEIDPNSIKVVAKKPAVGGG